MKVHIIFLFKLAIQLSTQALTSFGGESMIPLTPDFNTESLNITAIAGDTVTLPCAMEFKESYKVIWMNPRKTLISTDDSRYIDDSRLSVERPKIEDWNLMIREVRYNDSGEYMCQVNTKPVMIKRIYLFVKVSPEIIEDWAQTKIKVPEGETVELFCNASGVPMPVVTWFRQANMLIDYTNPDYGESTLVGEVLILHNITRYCDGLYQCNAENGVPPSAEKSFQVTVQFPPEVRIPTPRLGQSVGRETILECKVAASPHGSIVWRKDGRNIPLHIYKYSTMVYDEEDRHEKTLALNIIDIDKSDFGRYTCEAENKLGSDKEHMLLYEFRPMDRRHTTTTRPTLLWPVTTRKQRPATLNPPPYITRRPHGKKYYGAVTDHTGQCERTGGCYNELVVAFFSTGGGVKGPGKVGGGGYFNYRSGTSELLLSKELFLYMCLIQLYSCVSVHS